MCKRFLSIGLDDCYCIKTAFVECAPYRIWRLKSTDQVENNELYYTCNDFEIIRYPWAGRCRHRHHPDAEKFVAELNWMVNLERIVIMLMKPLNRGYRLEFEWIEDEEVGWVPRRCADFNWAEDVMALIGQTKDEEEQEAEFRELIEGDLHLTALVDGVNPAHIMKK